LRPSEADSINREMLSAGLTAVIDRNDLGAAERLSEDAITKNSDLLKIAIDVFTSSGSQAISDSSTVKGERLLRWAVALALAHDAPRPLFREVLGSVAKASGFFDGALETDPADAASYLVHGYAHWDKADYDRAIADFKRAIELQPKSAMIYEIRGHVYESNGQHDLAIADYTWVIEHQQGDAVLYFNRGNARYANEEYGNAIEDYKEAIKQGDPGDAFAYFYNRGLAYYANKEYKSAVEDFDEIIKRNPLYARAYLNRGDAHYAQEDYKPAVDDYSEVIKREPLCLKNRAVFLKNQATFEDDCKEDPIYARAYFKRGRAHRAKGDADNAAGNAKEEYGKAIEDYRETIKRNPQDVAAYWNRGFTYLILGENDQAIADATEALKLEPEGWRGASALYLRGSALFVMSEFGSASSDLGKAIDLIDDAYAMRGRYLARSRAGQAAAAHAELATNASRLKTKDWPYPVIELYLGGTPAATLKAVKDQYQRCEAQFSIGEWYILKEQTADAEIALRAATEICPKNGYEYLFARAELKRL
jgi:tetratricopeptide (TPR) repeat protein